MRISLSFATSFITIYSILWWEVPAVAASPLDFDLPTYDGQEFTFRPIVGFQTDALAMHEDVYPYEDSVEFHRIRLGVKGTFGEHVAWVVEGDAANEEWAWTSVYADMKLADAWKVRVGNFKEPYSLERVTSAFEQPLAERSLASALSSTRNLGAAAMWSGERTSMTFGAFTEALETSSNEEKLALTMRATHAPVLRDSDVVHIGLSGSYRGMRRTKFAIGPVSGIVDTDIAETVTVRDSDHVLWGGVETAFQYGRWWGAGEWVVAQVDRTTLGSSTLQGSYATIAYSLTGEQRRYAVDAQGSFKALVPDAPFDLVADTWGAWEVVGRVDTLDLNDGSLQGGQAKSAGIGLNWYWNEKVKWQWNHFWIATDHTSPTPDDHPQATILRLQVRF